MAFLYRKKHKQIYKRALHFIYDDYTNSYNYLLKQSKLPSLKIRRLRAMALETYRIICKTSPVLIHAIVKIKQNSYNVRYNNRADTPHTRTTKYGKKSFSYVAALLWNSLTDQARNLSTFGTFKNVILTWCYF